MPKASAFTFSVTLALAVTIPMIIPSIGNFWGLMSVTLQTSPSAASIYYTTNDLIPRPRSNLYTESMNLMNSVTVKAMENELAALAPMVSPAGTTKRSTLYADGQLSSNCTRGNYSITNRNCTGSDGNGYGGVSGVQNASNAADPGDTIIIRNFSGRYIGTGEQSLIRPRAGTVGSYLTTYTTYSGYAGDGCAALASGGANSSCPKLKGFDTQNGERYIYYKNLILDGENNLFSYGYFGLNFSRAENIEIKNEGDHGMLGVDHSELINLNVHHNGFTGCIPNPTQCHGIYTGGGTNNLFDGGEYHHNEGLGIHCYTKCSGTIIRNLRAHHNGSTGILMASDLVQAPSRIYNVVSDHNGTSGPDKGSGVQIAVSGVVAYNITTYNNSGGGVVSMGQSNHALRNCLCLDGAGARKFNGDPNDGGFSGGFSNNVTSGSASTYFVDAANGSFQVRPTSKAKGVGANLSSPKY